MSIDKNNPKQSALLHDDKNLRKALPGSSTASEVPALHLLVFFLPPQKLIAEFFIVIPLDLDYCCQFEFWNYKSPEKQKQGHGQEFKLGIQSIWTLGQPLSRDSK